MIFNILSVDEDAEPLTGQVFGSERVLLSNGMEFTDMDMLKEWIEAQEPRLFIEDPNPNV